MLKGLEVYPGEWENFDIHINEHQKILKEKINLPNEIKARILQHISDTKQIKSLTQQNISGNIENEGQGILGQEGQIEGSPPLAMSASPGPSTATPSMEGM